MVFGLWLQGCDDIRPDRKGSIPEQKIDSIFSSFREAGSPGCAVVVSDSEGILFSKGYGLANVEHNIAIGSNTVFDIASVSKQFTAYAAAKLIEEGLLSPEDVIKEYFPELQVREAITVSHLIHHTSGLRDWPQTLAIGGWSMEDQLTYEQILRMAFLQKELNYPPGSEYSYTNTGYVLLAELISRVTGQPFHEYISEVIFEPLEMTQSYFNHDIHTIIPYRAQSYHKSAAAGTYINYADNTTAMGSSSMFSTAEDLSKWLVFLSQNMDNDPIVKRMHQRGMLITGDTIPYAYGIWFEDLGGHEAVVHTGSWAGFRIITVRFPAEKISIVILSNASDFDRYGYAEKVAKVYLKDTYLVAEGEKEVFTADETASAVKGIFLSNPKRIYEITNTGGKLQLLVDGAIEYRLQSNGQNSFISLQDSDMIIEPLEAGSLLVGNDTVYKINEPARPFSDYQGVYYCDELQSSYEILENAGHLYANNIRYDAIEIEPLAEDVFESDAWFLGRMLFTRDLAGKVNGFEVFGGRVRRLSFRKVNL